MRIRRDSDEGGELINISSLLDVMFILIIFFLATTTFRQEERDAQVQLPDAGDSQTLSASPSVLVINVRSDGSYLLGANPVDLPDLRAHLSEAAERGTAKVLVRGDQNARHGAVAAAVLACKQAGIHSADIGYELPR
jgi:biopolymer transport protein ExbD